MEHLVINDAKHIGLDVHQATISAAVLDSAEKLLIESIVDTKAATILRLIPGLGGSLHVTLEGGTCTAWLHDLLKPELSDRRTKVVRFASDRTVLAGLSRPGRRTRTGQSIVLGGPDRRKTSVYSRSLEGQKTNSGSIGGTHGPKGESNEIKAIEPQTLSETGRGAGRIGNRRRGTLRAWPEVRVPSARRKKL